jgi:hypothetical protein
VYLEPQPISPWSDPWSEDDLRSFKNSRHLAALRFFAISPNSAKHKAFVGAGNCDIEVRKTALEYLSFYGKLLHPVEMVEAELAIQRHTGDLYQMGIRVADRATNGDRWQLTIRMLYG